MKRILIISLVVLLYMKVFSNVYKIEHMFFKTDADSINYVKNHSFEEYTACPFTIDGINNCMHWRKIPDVLDSPDYFNQCANQYIRYYEVTVGVPENSFGYQKPRTGEAYIGLTTFRKDYYREYIQTKLKHPLNKGVTYIIGMYVSLSNKSKYANDRFRFCLTCDSQLEILFRRHRGFTRSHLTCHNGVLYKSDTLINDTINWVNIEVEYIANGGEEFLTIGVFNGDISWWERIKKRRNVFNKKWNEYKYKVSGAYYFIDDVYVIRKEDYLKMMQYDE